MAEILPRHSNFLFAGPQAEYRDLLPPGLQQQQQQKLHVCDQCGSFLSIFDNDRRCAVSVTVKSAFSILTLAITSRSLADHFGGKMHVGYVKSREKHKELSAKFAGGRPSSR